MLVQSSFYETHPKNILIQQLQSFDLSHKIYIHSNQKQHSCLEQSTSSNNTQTTLKQRIKSIQRVICQILNIFKIISIFFVFLLLFEIKLNQEISFFSTCNGLK